MQDLDSTEFACRNASTHLYERPDFRHSAGRTLRPGGEALTLRGLELCGLVPARTDRKPDVLDVGCGAGATLSLLQSLGFSATGVEPSPDLLAETSTTLGDTVTVLPGTADHLPLADTSQDGVVCECVLSLTPNPDTALADMTRVLRPGGSLLLTDIYVRQGRLRADDASNSRLTASKACLRPFGGKDSGESLQSISSVKSSRQADGRSCLAGAMPLVALRELFVRHGLRIIAEEDHSRALAELAARLIFSDSGLNLGTWFGLGCDGACSNRELARRLGYILLAAVKEGP